VQHAGRRPADVDDLTLTDRVMSEVFGDEDIPKGSIDVNAEHGVIVLRGEVPTPQMIESVESRVRRVSGVRDVRNLLHLPKTPARSNAGPRR
jgi:osmotically-inducible protein OsmY